MATRAKAQAKAGKGQKSAPRFVTLAIDAWPLGERVSHPWPVHLRPRQPAGVISPSIIGDVWSGIPLPNPTGIPRCLFDCPEEIAADVEQCISGCYRLGIADDE
jgi:hypothetical protein